MNEASRYSVVARSAPVSRGERPIANDAIIKLLDAQTRLNEATENLLCHDDRLSLEAADKLLCDAVQRITKARAVVHELRRDMNGQPTIASTG